MHAKVPSGFGGVLRGVVFALLLVAAITVVMLGVVRLLGLSHGSVVYLIAVIVAAMRWGLVAAVSAAIAGVAASAFFFYPPILDFRVQDPQQVVDLVLFIFVAIITSQIAAQLNEARLRAETESLRQAMIDSVSHELRTPLASILGAATVLHAAPALAGDARLKELVHVVHEGAERLDDNIQNLLDATRISRADLRPRLEWSEPTDIVNAALERCRNHLASHRVELEIAADLPLLFVDSVLVQQALSQILDNAVKYSPAHSTIRVAARSQAGAVLLTVGDDGAGLTREEKTHMWDRFFRGERHLASSGGSGLGLWIASAFIAANGGRLAAHSEGAGRGTRITIELPVRADPASRGADE